MKQAIIAIVIAIIIVGGGFLIFHKSSKKTPTSTSTTTSSSNAPAVNNAILVTKTDSKLGQYLADPSGKALYTFNGDSSGVSNCTGTCLAEWPAYVDKGSTSNLPTGVSTLTRSDNGQVQFTYNGMPLYFFVEDGNGQVTGNNKDNFVIAKPAAGSSTSSSQSTTSPSSSTTNNSSSSSSNSSSSGYPY